MFEKNINIKIISNDEEIICKAQKGDNLLKIIRDNKINFDTPCNGNKKCGKCKVKIKEKTEIGPSSKKFLTETELNSGIRLACNTEIKNDITVELTNKIKDMSVLISGIER